MSIVCVGDAIEILVEHSQRDMGDHRRNEWRMAVTHNGRPVRDEVFLSEREALDVAAVLVRRAIETAEGVVFTWR